MHWPSTPVEEADPSAFSPPLCPWRACPSNRPAPTTGAGFHRHGSFPRADGRSVPRFLCLACRRTCSLQTFAVTYYLKRPELAVPTAAALQAGSGHRQIARSLRCAPASITRLAARLGRHALLLLARALGSLPRLTEPIVIDHFETFAFSQDYPFGIATAVGHASWFVYLLDPAPHRRGGRLSPAQAARARALRPPAPRGGYRGSFRRCLDRLARCAPPSAPLTLVTDDHRAYALALARHPARARFVHRAYPNPRRGPKRAPRSPQALERDRALFPVDLLHALVRHTAAHHRRETIAFGRRLNALMERMFLVAVWRNFVKARSERRPDPTTPAMHLGLTTEPWSWPRVLAARVLPWQLAVPPVWAELYRREWVTPALGPNRPHALVNAF